MKNMPPPAPDLSPPAMGFFPSGADNFHARRARCTELTAELSFKNTVSKMLLQNPAGHTASAAGYFRAIAGRAGVIYGAKLKALQATRQRIDAEEQRSHLHRAITLANENRPEEALLYCKQLMRTAPGDESTHALLHRMLATHPDYHAQINAVLESFKFRPRWTFGKGRLQRPLDIVTNPANNRIYVTDYHHKAVFSFDAEGTFRGQVAREALDPLGLSLSPAGEILVCDFAGGQLLTVDVQDQTKSRIATTSIPGIKEEFRHPLFAHETREALHLLVANQAGEKKQLVKVWPADETRPEAKPVPLGGVTEPNFFIPAAGGLLVCDKSSGRVMQPAENDRHPAPFFSWRKNSQTKRLAAASDHLWATIDRMLFKLTLTGELIFQVDLVKIQGRENTWPVGLAAISGRDGTRLYITDTGNACIDVYDI